MAKTSKDKKSASANKNKFKAEDKVFAMDGGDLYEAKVIVFFLKISPCFPFPCALLCRSLGFTTAVHEASKFHVACRCQKSSDQCCCEWWVHKATFAAPSHPRL